MKSRKILIVAAVLLAILTLSAVSATDEMSVNETQELSVDESDITLESDIGEETLQEDPIEPQMNVTTNDEDAILDGYLQMYVELPDDATGEITLYANDDEIETVDEIEYNWRGFNYHFEDFGEYNFQIDYSGDENYAPDTFSFNYVLENTRYNINIDTVEYGSKKAYIYTPEDFNGDITITYNGKKYSAVHEYDEEDVYDYYYFDPAILDYGDNTVTVSTGGYERFGAYEDEKIVEVRSWVKCEDFTEYLSNDEITITLPSDATGTFTLYTNNYNEDTYEDEYVEIISKEVTGGLASVPMNIFDVGYYNLNAKYEGNYKGFDDYISFEVRPIITLPRVLVNGNKDYVTFKAHENLEGTLTVEISDYNDQLLLTLNEDVINGEGKLEIPDLDEEKYYIDVIFENDDYRTFDGKYISSVNSTDFEMDIDCYFNEILPESDNNYIYISVPDYATGSFDIYIDGKKVYSVDVEETDYYLYYPLNTTGLDYGTHTVSVDFTSDEYKNSTWSQEFEVVSAMIYIPEEYTYNSERDDWSGYDIHVTVNEDATGTITVLFNGEEYKTVQLNKKARYVIPVEDIAIKTHNVTVTYSGDGKYPEISKTSTMDVSYVIHIYNTDISYDERYPVQISAPKDIDPNKMIVTIDKEKCTFEASEYEGRYQVSVSDLTYGNHEIIVKYLGDDFYPESEFNETIEIYSNIYIPYRWAENEDINLILPEDATGSLHLMIYKVTYDDNSVEQKTLIKDETIPLEKGIARYSLNDFAIGEYYIEGDYNGNYNITPTDNTFIMGCKIYWDEEINEYDPEIKIGETATIYIDTPRWEGEFEVEIRNNTGEEWDEEIDDYVTTYDTVAKKTIALSDGKASYTIKDLDLGNYAMYVRYVRDSEEIRENEYYLNIIPIELNVPDEINLNDPQNIIIKLPEDTIGDVNVKISTLDSDEDWEYFDEIASEFENGIAEIDLSQLEEGTYRFDIEIVTENHGLYTNSYSYIYVTNEIELLDPNLKASAENVNVGSDVALNIEIDKAITGKVTVDGNEVTITNGKGTYTISNLASGNYTKTVKFDGDSKFESSQKTVRFTVSKLPAPEIEINVPESIVEKNDLEVEVAIPGATGTITVNGEEIALTDGKAKTTIKNVDAGNLTINVDYNGDDRYLATSGSKTVEVTKKVLKDAGLKVSANNAQEGKDITVSIEISKDITGKVTIDANEVTITNGKGTYTISNLASGNYTKTVIFEGDDDFKADEKTVSFSVTTAPSPADDNSSEENATPVKVDPKIVAKDMTVQYYAGKYYQVTVYGDDSKVASGVSVTFTLNGKKVTTTKTNEKGIAKFKVTQTPVTKAKIITNALGVSVTKKLTISRVIVLKAVTVKKSAKKLVLQATLKKVNGKYLKGKKITFKFNGKKYTAKTDKKGIAKVTIKSNILKKLKVGKKITYQATYVKDTVKKTVKVKK